MSKPGIRAVFLIAIAELLQEIEPPRRDAVDSLKQNMRDKAEEAKAHLGNIALAHLHMLLQEMNARLRAEMNARWHASQTLN